jgi:tripartite-type tricarboxylate transporter receptor subunit TctC
MKRVERHLLIVFMNWVLLAPIAQAAERAFYQGKNVNFVINFAAGGPTDIEGRIVARHLAKHIPGNPTIIVQNMPGAGGVTGINFLGEVAKPDGMTMGYFTGPYNHQMMRTPSLRVDLNKVPFIASVQGVTVCYIRSDVPPGIKKSADIAKAERFRAGGLSFDSNKDLRFRLAFDVMGLKYEALKAANLASQNMNRVALVPPATPPAAVAALRQAFLGLSKDEEFLSEAQKVMKFHPRFETGADGERLRQKVTQVSNEIVNFVREYVEQARK